MKAPWKGKLRVEHDTGYLPDIVDESDAVVIEAVDAEDASVLVHRTNVHDELVEALEATTVTGHYAECIPGQRGNPPSDRCSHVCKQVRAALASAKGEG